MKAVAFWGATREASNGGGLDTLDQSATNAADGVGAPDGPAHCGKGQPSATPATLGSLPASILASLTFGCTTASQLERLMPTASRAGHDSGSEAGDRPSPRRGGTAQTRRAPGDQRKNLWITSGGARLSTAHAHSTTRFQWAGEAALENARHPCFCGDVVRPESALGRLSPDGRQHQSRCASKTIWSHTPPGH